MQKKPPLGAERLFNSKACSIHHCLWILVRETPPLRVQMMNLEELLGSRLHQLFCKLRCVGAWKRKTLELEPLVPDLMSKHRVSSGRNIGANK